MLLNAANVVTAAERCHAIDEKTGRIPINFLLSRSNDLEDHVKDELQRLAVQSPSISIRSPPPTPSHLSRDRLPQSGDPVPSDARLSNESLESFHHKSRSRDVDRHRSHFLHQSVHYSESSGSLQEHSVADEEEALKDIDLESKSVRQDRKGLHRLHHKGAEQTLTRKAIRKHTGGKKGPMDLSLFAKDASSTINTVSASSGVQSSQGSVNTPRRRWKEWEDELLISVVEKHGPTRWNTLAHNFPGRNGRQVRLRWMNHLQPSLNKRPWKPEEDAVLLEAHNDLGNKWALISSKLRGRTDNSVKNRYKSIVRRNAREAKARRQQQQHTMS